MRNAEGEFELVSRPLKTSSIRALLGCLSAFYETCIDRGRRLDNPTRGIARQRSPKKVGATLTDESAHPRCEGPAALQITETRLRSCDSYRCGPR